MLSLRVDLRCFYLHSNEEYKVVNWPYPRVAAHRGGGTLAPENTLAAIRVGAKLGLKMVEFDAKLSADEVAFLLHDDTVNRTSDGWGAAARKQYAAITRLDAGSWFDGRFSGEWMPTLQQASECCSALGLAVNVEIKPCPGRETLTGHIVAGEVARWWKGTTPPALLSSFSLEALCGARDAAAHLPRGWLVGAVPVNWREHARALGCVSLHVDHRQLTAARIAQISEAGLRILAYTVNTPERARELVEWGVDTICTDRIDLIGADFFG
ncbi:Glycerophosphoryl diester phosphodiesterase (EC 3.1.4.46) [Mycetohabitans rhizoxinica HKI 454]|uniref:Glycerophosphoryl diester phosphodiesterase n=1 Tax=Mycetohabitans rhizoxinica (strain DSM 19002 / CIP 109453 / HKI 454) TaxID=882378 RepID=E5APS3_MYCRK|nr:Glycerophosphoryl diester phosphodiesterase (EC 3.1.4.46) [Mycetohabitans rhizoxinica HKI 454]